MKICVTSDTHGRDFTAQPADVFIHCGDITAGGTVEETALFASWLHDSPYKHAIVVPGNHDRCFQEEFDAVRELFDDRVHILIDKGVQIDGVNFWGSPWTPPFFDWFFMKEEDDLRVVYSRMPQEIDVLITHGPPRGILDPGHKEPHVGSRALLGAITDKSRKIKHHVFGHLHAAGGKMHIGPGIVGEDYRLDTRFYNVAACNEAYNLVNQPIILEI